MTELAARVRAARGWANLSQDELADRLGLERQSILRTERGARDPKKGELIAIATVCGVPVGFMLNGFDGAARDEIADGVATLVELARQLLGSEADRIVAEAEAAASRRARRRPAA